MSSYGKKIKPATKKEWELAAPFMVENQPYTDCEIRELAKRSLKSSRTKERSK